MPLPRHSRSLLAAIVLLAVLPACADRAAGTASPTAVRDSSGVRIATTGAEDRPLGWRFTDRATYSDSAGAPFLFAGIADALVAVSSAGEVLALDAGNHRIVRFDTGGRQVATMGGKGGGPGEMLFPMGLAVQGDTVVVFDPMRNGFLRWSVAGAVLPDARAEESQRRMQGGFGYVQGALWHAYYSLSDSAETSELVSIRDGRATTYATLRRPRGRAVQFHCFALSSAQPILTPSLHWSANRDGVAVAAQPEYVVNLLAPDGRTRVSIRRDLPTRAPTADDVRAVFPEGMKVSFGGRGGCTIPVEELMEKQGVAPTVPLVNGLTLLDDGTLWVRRSLGRTTGLVSDVFDRDGTYRGTARDVHVLRAFPDGDLLVAREDEGTGGFVLVRVRVTRGS
jgi:outer membrane protein assembly factor BamB